jgi:transposase
MNESMLSWVGLDVAKRTFDAAVASPGQRATAATIRGLPVETFERTPEGVKQFAAWLRTHVPARNPLPVRAVMEATGAYSVELAALLCKECPELLPSIANPERTSNYRKSLGLRNKTDRLDARALAFFGLDRHPEPYEPLSRNQAELRALSRCRDDLIETRKAHENQLAEGPQSAAVRKVLTGILAHLARAIETIEQQMHHIIEADENLRRDYQLITSIPGVGFITAAVVLAEFGDLRRFGRSRQIGAHAGVTACHNDSGEFTGPSHMSKKGSGRVRQALYMAAMSAKKFNPIMRSCYQRFISEGKEPMVAIGAIMRKLLVLMRALVISNCPFDPAGRPRGKKAQPATQNA